MKLNLRSKIQLLLLAMELQIRFKKLLSELTKEDKEENKIELNLLLQEMLRQDYITHDEYEKVKITCRL